MALDMMFVILLSAVLRDCVQEFVVVDDPVSVLVAFLDDTVDYFFIVVILRL